jgi:hypothetical protein
MMRGKVTRRAGCLINAGTNSLQLTLMDADAKNMRMIRLVGKIVLLSAMPATRAISR